MNVDDLAQPADGCRARVRHDCEVTLDVIPFERLDDRCQPGRAVPRDGGLVSRELNGGAPGRGPGRRPAPAGQRARPERQLVAPTLEGIKYKGRWIVIYSKYDIGCALEKAPSPDCIGHDYDSAVRLGRAAVLWSGTGS